MKIGQYLSKIWTRVQCATFFETRCSFSAREQEESVRRYDIIPLNAMHGHHRLKRSRVDRIIRARASDSSYMLDHAARYKFHIYRVFQKNGPPGLF